MKFEKPIAEIEKFQLNDVISASGGAFIPRQGHPVIEGSCSGHADDYEIVNCP